MCSRCLLHRQLNYKKNIRCHHPTSMYMYILVATVKIQYTLCSEKKYIHLFSQHFYNSLAPISKILLAVMHQRKTCHETQDIAFSTIPIFMLLLCLVTGYQRCLFEMINAKKYKWSHTTTGHRFKSSPILRINVCHHEPCRFWIQWIQIGTDCN